jgi:hypothetical protein
MATNALTGNMATENVLQVAKEQELVTGIDLDAFNTATEMASHIFNKYH